MGPFDQLRAILARVDGTVYHAAHGANCQHNGDSAHQNFGTNGCIVEPASHKTAISLEGIPLITLKTGEGNSPHGRGPKIPSSTMLPGFIKIVLHRHIAKRYNQRAVS